VAPPQPDVVCGCATPGNQGEWFSCPGDAPIGEAQLEPGDTYALKSCPGQPVEVTLYPDRVRPTGNVTTDADAPPPNVLFLEVDSVSLASARRHLPRTLALLAEYTACDGEGPCAVPLRGTSVVGRASIHNQLAALTGCSIERIGGSVETPAHKRPGRSKLDAVSHGVLHRKDRGVGRDHRP